jgi:hypothetical protein
VKGASLGLLAGVVSGLLGELMVLVVSRIFPTDVLIVGFALVWAVPLGIAVGAAGEWFGWFSNNLRLLLASSAPGLLAGAAAALIQWSAV